MQSPAQVAVQERGSPAQSGDTLRAARASAPAPRAVGPGWAGLPRATLTWQDTEDAEPCAQPWLTQPWVATELQQHTRTRVLMATWGTRMALRTRHGEGSTVPQDTAMDSTHTAMLGACPGTAGPCAGTSPWPHNAAMCGTALQSPPAWLERNWSRGSNLWLQVPHLAPAAPHRSHSQCG